IFCSIEMAVKSIYRLLLASLALHASTSGTVTELIGTGHNWNVTWQAISGQNDGTDGVSGELDFVGDNSNPCLYTADDGSYIHFRMRLATATAGASTFSGAHMILIDRVGYTVAGGTGTNTNGSLPDFAFSWDSKSNSAAAHGLEMSILSTRSNTWNGINFNDLDTSNSSKGANDINGGGRSMDGYVRCVDSQATVNLGTTTFLEFAVSWNYLETYTPLARGQQWLIGAASIANATDHNNLNADIAGGATNSDPTTIGMTSIPEPGIVAICTVCALCALVWRKRLST
ncbi:MAG TPA: hypothetical protein VFY13_04745, partial [Luteolibacter sp.]|nr:hypothetical protein [Luteolibacter sp.]